MRRPPGRPLLPFTALVATAILAGSCVRDDGPTGVGGSWETHLPISPALIPSPADAGAQPINRIRVTAVRAADEVVLSNQTFDVSPTDAQWTLDMSVTLVVQSVDVMLHVLLIHAQGGLESVEFSGRVGPLTLTRGSPMMQVTDVPILRGPLSNHLVTGLAISSAPDTLIEGTSATLRATTTTSGAEPPRVFWTVLDSAVLSVTDSTVTGVAPGTGRVVASAGAFVDTASIVVRTAAPPPANVDVEIRKTVDEAQPTEGATVTFTVSAINHGPGDVTSLAVFDTLRTAAFTGAQHTVSAGALVGDSLWTIPTLAQGATATWTTTATVTTGVAGGTATNRAILRSLARPDTVPANDTAQVTLSFPLSPVPVVTISQPADSATFDPGDLVTFTAAASDDPDGDLSPSIVWTSSRDGQLGTGRSVSTSVLSTGVHTIAATATDSDGGVGADTVTVIVSLYSVPPTLNVPFGGTASLPITLSAPAPTGGVTLNVTSDDATVTTPTAPTVFIPQGAQSANATLSGIRPGTASVTVGNPQYGNAVSTVSVTAALDILASNVSFPSPFTADITIEFESQGVAISAPAGGLPVTLTSRNPACVAAPPTVTISAGQTTRSATLSYGGTATTTCQSYVVASATDVMADSVLVSVTAPATITVAARTIGNGLQESSGGALNATGHNGVTLTLTSSDPSRILVSPNATTPGTASIDIPMAAGANGYSFYVQGVEGAQPGTATVTATAAGFNQGTATMTLVQPGIVLAGPSANLTTLSPDDAFYAFVGTPSGNSVNAQNVRAGGSAVSVTFDLRTPAVGQLTDGVDPGTSVTATIAPGLYYTPTSVANGGVAYDPIAEGTDTISVSASGFIAMPLATRGVTITAPTITVAARTVGNGLQESSGGALNATGHGGVTLTLTSSDPTRILVSPNATTPGTASIDIPMAAGANGYSFYVQGVEGAQPGTATVTATAAGFNQGTATMTLVQPGIVLAGPSANLTTLSPDDPFYAFIGTPSGNSVNAQNVRAGGSAVSVTFNLGTPAVGQLTDGVDPGTSVTATIAPGLYYTPTSVASGGVAYDPIAAGVDSVSVSAGGFIAMPLATRGVTVTAPTITVAARTVGNGLQESSGGALNATGHGGVTLTLTSSDPSRILVSPNATTPGTESIDIPMGAGANGYSFYVQGVEGAQPGTATVTATAAGFNQGTATMTLVQPAVALAGPATSTTTLSPDDPFYAFVGTPSGNSVNAQNVRAGGSGVTVTFAVDNAGVGLLRTSSTTDDVVTATIVPGLYYTPTSVASGGVAFDPLGVGTATITATAQGFTATPAATRSVSVSAPQITLSPRTVGGGLQESTGGALNATGHPGVTLTLTSSDPNTLLVSPNSTTPGTPSIDIQMGAGTNGFSFYVQGVEGTTGTATVTATASGFLNGTTTMTVVQPGIALSGPPTSTTAGANDIPFYAYVGYPSGNGVNAQNVRAGSPGLTVTASSTNAAAARLVTQTQSGASVTAVIVPGLYYTPTSVGTGGFALDPLAQGQTTISAAAPGFIVTPAGSVTVNVNP